MSSESISLRSWLTLAALGIVWGSSFILIKKSLIALTPVELACARISITALSFVPILYYHRREVDWSRWVSFGLVGATGSGIPAFCYAIAQTKVNSSISGMLNSMTPIFALIIGVIIYGAAINRYKVLGAILGFSGVLMLIIQGGEAGWGGDIRYVGLILIGTICYGLSVNMVKHLFQKTRSILISATSFTLIGPPAIVYLLMTISPTELMARPDIQISLLAVTGLALMGTVISTIFFYRLVQDTDAVFASSVAYLIPIVALLWGTLDGEQIGLYHLVGMAVILVGVYLTKINKA